jgi:hypothetical protein
MIPDLMTMTTYSVVSGIVIYAGLYAYILLYNKSLLPFFNKIITYVVGVDVLLSMIYYYTLMNSQKGTITENKENDALDIVNDDTESYTDSDEGSDVCSDTDAESDIEQIYNKEDLDQNVLKSEFQNVEVFINENANQQMNTNQQINNIIDANQQMNTNQQINNIIDANQQINDNNIINIDYNQVTQVSTDTIRQDDTLDKKLINDDNNLLNNLINQLSTVNTTVTINDNNINVINDTNESVQTIKRRRRRTKKEIEQELLTKTSNKTNTNLNKTSTVLNNLDVENDLENENAE